MKKSKTYSHVFFKFPHVLEALKELQKNTTNASMTFKLYVISKDGNERWMYENQSEFFQDYSKDTVYFEFCETFTSDEKDRYEFYFYSGPRGYITLSIEAPSKEIISSVFNIFEKYINEDQLPIKIEARNPPVVFIGHGGDNQWKELKDHLQDKHGLRVEAYEIGVREGHGIRDILESMLKKSSVAFIVMTGEDEDASGNKHARDNVIHELGLFQGKLGFSKAIIALENGTVEFSNIHGIQQLRFEKGNIKSIFGEVIALINRESDS